MQTFKISEGEIELHSGFRLPRTVFDTKELGSRCDTLSEVAKLEIVKERIKKHTGPVAFDTAGKYGAGLALETLGRCLQRLSVSPKNVIISNKLGWIRTEMKADDIFFGNRISSNLKYKAVQKIGYDGIMECFEQGNELLGGYIPQMVSVHEPDEYFAKAKNWQEKLRLYDDILDAYEALYDLKHKGKVKAIGAVAKSWEMVKRIADDVPLDWIMLEASPATLNQQEDALDFVQEMNRKGVCMINKEMAPSYFFD